MDMPHSHDSTEEAKENLRQDFQALLHDAKALLDATTGDASERTKEARERLAERIDKARARLGVVEHNLHEKADKVDQFVRRKPYQAAGITLVAGAFLGWFFARK